MLSLDTPIKVQELFSWKLHWAICRIDDLIGYDAIRSSFRRGTDVNSIDELKTQIAGIKGICDDIERAIWEISTITDNDYAVDVRKLISTIPKYIAYQEHLERAREKILQSADIIHTREKSNLVESMDKFK